MRPEVSPDRSEPSQTTRGSLRLLAAWTLAVLGAVGCAVEPSEVPRTRQGGLPFPGWATLYRPADPAELGQHRTRQERRFLPTGEGEWGILYTTRAGFLDLAHIRMAIDWTRYAHDTVAQAIDERAEYTSMIGANGSVVHINLNYPADWDALPPEERTALSGELSLRVGQRVAYLITNWHELATWFGSRRVGMIDEAPSAFTYDDVMAHLVGLSIAEQAIRDGGPFDDAVTAQLETKLQKLGVVSAEQTGLAVRAVEGSWWKNGRPTKRQLDVGYVEGYVRPWLVPGLEFAPVPPGGAEAFYLPSLQSVRGRDMALFYQARIEPRLDHADEIRAMLPQSPYWFAEFWDVPRLIEAARSEMRQRDGADVDLPYPVAMRPAPAN